MWKWSASDIQDCLEYIIKEQETFAIDTEYYPELLATETMELFGSTDNKITSDKMVKMYLRRSSISPMWDC